MDIHNNETVSILRELLDIVEKEKDDIMSRNLERIEHYCALKEDLAGRLEKTGQGMNLTSGRERSGEIEDLLNRIIAANKENERAVRQIKHEILNDISSLHKNKKAFEAYRN